MTFWKSAFAYWRLNAHGYNIVVMGGAIGGISQYDFNATKAQNFYNVQKGCIDGAMISWFAQAAVLHRISRYEMVLWPLSFLFGTYLGNRISAYIKK
jgi:hypothetical protein